MDDRRWWLMVLPTHAHEFSELRSCDGQRFTCCDSWGISRRHNLFTELNWTELNGLPTPQFWEPLIFYYDNYFGNSFTSAYIYSLGGLILCSPHAIPDVRQIIEKTLMPKDWEVMEICGRQKRRLNTSPTEWTWALIISQMVKDAEIPAQSMELAKSWTWLTVQQKWNITAHFDFLINKKKSISCDCQGKYSSSHNTEKIGTLCSYSYWWIHKVISKLFQVHYGHTCMGENLDTQHKHHESRYCKTKSYNDVYMKKVPDVNNTFYCHIYTLMRAVHCSSLKVFSILPF